VHGGVSRNQFTPNAPKGKMRREIGSVNTVSKAKAAISAGARDYFVKGREEGLVELVNRILAGGDK
jgi:hypothetical protein